MSSCPPLPQLTLEDVMQCQFSKWYDTFRTLDNTSTSNGTIAAYTVEGEMTRPRRRRTNVTIDSIIIPLPKQFISYLLSDGVRLPEGATRLSSFVPNERADVDEWSDDEPEEASPCGRTEDDHNNDEEGDEEYLRQFKFPELNQQVEDAISRLGGSVVPKMNWSCPKDATWVNNGTLQCRTVGDVYLLLKSSDFVLHDVLHAFDDTLEEGEASEIVSYELILRKWCNLHPSMEFRCFVWNRKLLAISQRNHTQHFSHVVRDQHGFRAQLEDFFEDVVRDRFALPNYSFDCYIDKQDRVWLLDFNVWDRRTDSLLYTWEELMTMTTVSSERSATPTIATNKSTIRVVETELEVQQDPLASYRAPIDTIDLASSKNFEEFMKLCKKPSDHDCL